MTDWPTRLAKYDGLIFDCDGTLTDSMPLHYRAWNSTMTRHGIDFPEAKFYEWGGMPTDTIIKRLSGEQSVQVDVEAAGNEKEAAFTALLDELQPRSNVVQIVHDMNGRVAMSVASGGFRDPVRAQIKHIGLLDLLPIIVTAEDTQRHKPEPDVFLEAARRMNIPPALCLVLEDSPLGFAAAKAAGMDSVDVRGDDWVWYCDNAH